jgi:predicted phage terminase large subunit-like protein
MHFPLRGKKIGLVGPRGGAKSTIGSLAVPLRRALEGDESYIVIASDTLSQAVEHLSNIKFELETNQKIREAYPEVAGKGPVWRRTLIQLRNGVEIRAIGTLSRIRGTRKQSVRPTLLIADDIESDLHVRSEAMRRATWDWFCKTFLNLGDSNTNVLLMGTALHRECVVLRTMRNPGWNFFRPERRPEPFRAIQQWPEDMGLWDDWQEIYMDIDNPRHAKLARQFYRRHHLRMRKGMKLLWPSKEGLYRLMKLRAEIGRTSFESEKQSNPVDPLACEWPEEYFDREDFWFDSWPKKCLCRSLTLDPSKGAKSKKGDYCAIVSLLVDDQGTYYADCDMQRRPAAQIAEKFVQVYENFRPEFVGVEVNQFQELLRPLIEDVASVRGLEFPIEPIDSRVNKDVRIRRIGPVLHVGKIRFKKGSPGAVMLVEQLREFPNAEHDDGPDALEMAMRIMVSGTRDRDFKPVVIGGLD